MKKAPTTYQADGALGEPLDKFITRQGFCPIPPWQANRDEDSLERLQALASSMGLVLHAVTPAEAATAFLVARKAASCEFTDLAGVRRFVDEWAGGYRG